MGQLIAASVSDPRGEYLRRKEERLASSAAQMRQFQITGGFRVAAMFAGLVMLWPVLERSLAAGWLMAPVVLFIGLGVIQERQKSARLRLDRAVRFYERGIARIDDRWVGQGETGERFLTDSHPYAADLDVFGKGSLYELLSTARTRAGEETLARWLCEPAAAEEVRSRQVAVAELRDKLDFREEISILGMDVRTGVHPETLSAWGFAAHVPFPAWTRPLAILLGVLGGASLVCIFTYKFGTALFAAAILLESVFHMRLRGKLNRVLLEIEHPKDDLGLLAGILSRIENERFSSTYLVNLCQSLKTGGLPPSKQIARLNRLIERLDWRLNPVFAPLAALAMWSLHFAISIEHWRRVNGPAVARWLAVAGEIEALCSLACYSFEHPRDPFPELIEEEPLFDAEALGHPLIPDLRCVRNDLRLGADLRVLIVSGSNMSGKSTLLRAAGANVVLALAGAPVRAKRLRLSPLALGASIRIVDSLQAGSSRFYAEITRLRQILELTTSKLPLFFLLDEILHGTNSHDRRIGAEAVVTGLAARGAIGLVTTHDLALSHIADSLATKAVNVHFEDHIEDGKMIFDYRMRPGVVQKSNAIALMRSVGLDV